MYIEHRTDTTPPNMCVCVRMCVCVLCVCVCVCVLCVLCVCACVCCVYVLCVCACVYMCVCTYVCVCVCTCVCVFACTSCTYTCSLACGQSGPPPPPPLKSYRSSAHRVYAESQQWSQNDDDWHCKCRVKKKHKTCTYIVTWGGGKWKLESSLC